MILLGTMVNAATVAAGGTIGCLVGSRMPARLAPAAFRAIGLFTLVIGFSMALETENFLILAASCIIGSIAGEALRVESGLLALGNWLKRRTRLSSSTLGEGMTAAFLLFCMGSMTIVGAIEEGLGGSSELLLTKALMDGFAAMMLASALGYGVILSIIPLVVYQGGLTLVASAAGASLPRGPVTEMSAVGGVILVALGINILELKKIRVADLLPALPAAALIRALLG